MRPSFGDMSPEGRNNVVQEFSVTGSVFIADESTQLTRRMVAVFKQGLHTATLFQARAETRHFKNKLLRELSVCPRKKCTFHIRDGEIIRT